MFHIGLESSTVGSPLSLGGKVLGGELADNRESQAGSWRRGNNCRPSASRCFAQRPLSYSAIRTSLFAKMRQNIYLPARLPHLWLRYCQKDISFELHIEGFPEKTAWKSCCPKSWMTIFFGCVWWAVSWFQKFSHSNKNASFWSIWLLMESDQF